MMNLITHVAINVKNMDATLKFYQDTLGFEKIFEINSPDTGSPWIVYIQVCAGQFLELFYGGEPKTAKDEDIGFTHLCFAVENVAALAKHITDKGYALEIPLNIGCDNNLQAWIRDPNGVRIELMQVSPDSPHAAFM